MKIMHMLGSSTSRRARITLETAEERSLTPDQLLLIVDNAEGIAFDSGAGSYWLTGGSLGAARHFGGSVDVGANPDERTVTVYID